MYVNIYSIRTSNCTSNCLIKPLRERGLHARATISYEHRSTSQDLDLVEERSHGQWRIFSKLGAGYSTSRGMGEITYNR